MKSVEQQVKDKSQQLKALFKDLRRSSLDDNYSGTDVLPNVEPLMAGQHSREQEVNENMPVRQRRAVWRCNFDKSLN